MLRNAVTCYLCSHVVHACDNQTELKELYADVGNQNYACRKCKPSDDSLISAKQILQRPFPVFNKALNKCMNPSDPKRPDTFVYELAVEAAACIWKDHEPAQLKSLICKKEALIQQPTHVAGDQIQMLVKVDGKEYKVFLWRTGQVRWMHEIVRSKLVVRH
jgi:hypothetical protein